MESRGIKQLQEGKKKKEKRLQYVVRYTKTRTASDQTAAKCGQETWSAKRVNAFKLDRELLTAE